MNDQQIAERIRQMLQSKIEPPNKTVAYLINKLKDVEGEMAVVAQNIIQTQNRLKELQIRMDELRGQSKAYVEDIQAWDKELIEGEELKEQA